MITRNVGDIGWDEKWPAPAKLNLMLRIVGRRTDGYHLLQTVFQFVDLCDWLRFSPIEDDRIVLKRSLPGVLEHDDLTVKAAKLLKLETGCKKGVVIDLEKNLPMGGGVGGGSSDAATVLLVLNKLWDCKLSEEKLIEIGLKLGADVPIFLFGFSAWAEGVGEKLHKIELPGCWYLIIDPKCHVSTKEIFLAENLTRNSKSITIADFMDGLHTNDCLDVVCELYQPVNDAIADLSKFAEARLTGTGGCVFAQFESEEKANVAFSALCKNWQVYIARGLNQSPLSLKVAGQ